MRRRGLQCLRQAPEWLKVSWSFDNNVIKESAAGRLSKIAHSHSCATIKGSNSQVFKSEFHCGRGNVNLGFSAGIWANWVHSCAGARSCASASAAELPSEKNHDEIVDRFEKLLQKWSSNTPLLLKDLQVNFLHGTVLRPHCLFKVSEFGGQMAVGFICNAYLGSNGIGICLG